MSVARSDPSRATQDAPGPVAGGADAPGAARARDQEGERTGAPATPPAKVSVGIRVVVLVAVVAGLVLRFVARSPLWLDEALSVDIARLPIDQIPEALRHDGHPPLYYVLLHLWMQVVGTGDTAVRSLSGVISMVSLPVAFVAGDRAGGKRLAWLLLGVFAINPFVLRYATETRMYSLLVLLVLVGYILLVDLVRRGRHDWGRVVALVAVVAGLLYSHYWSMWLLGGVGVVLLVVRQRTADPDVRVGATRALLAIVGGGLCFLPWLPVLLYQSKHTGTPWAGPVRPTSMLASTLTDFGGGAFKDAQLVGGVLLVLVLLAVFGTAVGTRRIELDLRTAPQFRAEASVVAVTIVLALAVSYATRSAFVTRYASTFLPLVLLLAAGGVSRVADRRVQAGVLVALLGLFGLGCVYNLTTDRTQAKVIADQVAARHRPGDLVVYCPDQLGPAALRVMPDDLQQVAFPTLDRPDRIDWVDYNDRNRVDPVAYAQTVMAAAGPAKGIFVVWSGGYKTHQGTCDALVAAIDAQRPPAQTLVSEDGDVYFEHANLTYFAPVDPAPAS